MNLLQWITVFDHRINYYNYALRFPTQRGLWAWWDTWTWQLSRSWNYLWWLDWHVFLQDKAVVGERLNWRVTDWFQTITMSTARTLTDAINVNLWTRTLWKPVCNREKSSSFTVNDKKKPCGFWIFLVFFRSKCGSASHIVIFRVSFDFLDRGEGVTLEKDTSFIFFIPFSQELLGRFL